MTEQFVDLGEVTLCYEVLGDDLPADAPTVVLVMGLGLDLLWWRDDFCADLVGRGLRVIRFDNRDVGRSTRLAGPVPGPLAYLTRRATLTYGLEDMADDTGALIAELAPGGAHVVGVSLGSMIAQQTAIRFPDRVRSLVSIMGRPGDGRSGKMSKLMALRSARPGPADPVENLVTAFGRIGSRGRTRADDDDVRHIVPRSSRRAGLDYEDGGAGRQLAAILREKDRTAGLRGFDRPALVIHGDHDRVIRPSGGRTTAAALPDAELLVLPGMGHDLARRLWPAVLDGIERTVRRGEAAALAREGNR